MKLYRLFTIMVIAAVLAGCAQTSWIKQNFDVQKPAVDSIAILFPHVQYSEKNGESKIIKNGHSVFVSRKVAEVLKGLIDDGTFISKSAVIICDSSVIDDWLPRCFSNSIPEYMHLSDSLTASNDGQKTFPVTSGLQSLVDKVTTKYFIFVNGVAFGTSEETKRYDVLQAQTFMLFYDRPFVYDYQWSGLKLHVYVVDTQSKEILWYNSNDSRDTKYDPIKEEEIKALCRKLIQIN